MTIHHGRHFQSVRFRMESGARIELAGLNLRTNQEPNQFDGFLTMKRMSGKSQARTSQGADASSSATRYSSITGDALQRRSPPMIQSRLGAERDGGSTPNPPERCPP